MLKISKAALLATVLSLSVTPAILAEDSSSSSAEENTLGNDTTNSHSSTTDSQFSLESHVSIPSVTAVGSSMDEAALRDALTGGFSKHVDELAKLSATSITIPEITLTMSSKAGDTSATSTVSYKDLVLTNVKNGVAESASIGSATSKTADGTFTFGKMSTGLLDIGGILALYQMVPSGGADQPVKPIYKDFTWEGAKFETAEVSCDVGKIHTDEFDARPLKVSFGELMDASKQMENVQTGATPPPEAMGKVIAFLTDIFQAFKSTPTSVGAINCTGKNKDGKDFALGLGGLQMDGFSPGSYPAITVNDLKIAAEDGHIDLKSATFKSIDFSQAIATLNAAGTVDPSWFETNWRRIIPAWAGLSVSGLSVDVPDEKNPGERVQVELADFDLSLSDYLNGIPTKITSSAHGVSVPLPPDSDDDTAKLLKAIGITKINANYELAASWDKASQSVKIDKVSVSGNDLGSVMLTALIGNATEQLFDPDPQVEQAASMGVTVKNITLTASDDGLGDKLVPMLAEQQHADPATYRTQLAGIAEGAALQMLGSTDAARALGRAVGDFLAGKAKSVSINVAAKDPSGISVPMLMQAGNDPTVLASAVDITGSTPQ